MARFNEIVDLYWNDVGDFSLGENGDIEDTRYSEYRGFIQRLLTRLESKKGEWATQTSIGANLGQFAGKQNTQEVGARISRTIHAEIIADDLLRSAEFTVDVFPVSQTEVAIALIINPPRVSGQKVITFTYDLRHNRLIPRNV